MSSSTTSSSTRSPYIGSVISLISKSAVRYAGILSNVNLQEETIALEQVRCFGSEGRKGNPAEELPSSNTIYEYVVFRAADITNLKVCEPPKPLSTVPNDPAIVNVMVLFKLIHHHLLLLRLMLLVRRRRLLLPLLICRLLLPTLQCPSLPFQEQRCPHLPSLRIVIHIPVFPVQY